MKQLLLLLCLAVPIIYGSFNVAEICKLIPNGIKFQDPSDCSQWYVCADGIPSQPNSCANGTYFDATNQACLEKDQATCNKDPCGDQTSGIFVADPTSCTSYLYCMNGVPARGVCPNNFNYDIVKKVCTTPLNYECTNTTLNYQQLCLSIPDNIFIADSEDCQGWYTCKKNLPSRGQCPAGYLFDTTTAACNFTDNVECGSRSTAYITTVQTPKPAGDCTNPGTYISDNKTCSGFYYCYHDGISGSFLMFGECNSDSFFDATERSCANRTLVDCTYDRCIGGVKWVSVANTECKVYHRCDNGYTGYCPEDFPYFDESTQHCVKTKITYPSCV